MLPGTRLNEPLAGLLIPTRVLSASNKTEFDICARCSVLGSTDVESCFLTRVYEITILRCDENVNYTIWRFKKIPILNVRVHPNLL